MSKLELSKHYFKVFVSQFPEVVQDTESGRERLSHKIELIIERGYPRIQITNGLSETETALGAKRLTVKDLYDYKESGKYEGQYKRKPYTEVVPQMYQFYTPILHQIAVNNKQRQIIENTMRTDKQ